MMKLRESGMPDEAWWESLFDVPLILDRLGIHPQIGDAVEPGCGYGTFTIPVAPRIRDEGPRPPRGEEAGEPAAFPHRKTLRYPASVGDAGQRRFPCRASALVLPPGPDASGFSGPARGAGGSAGTRR
jgi:hypothetical protein